MSIRFIFSQKKTPASEDSGAPTEAGFYETDITIFVRECQLSQVQLIQCVVFYVYSLYFSQKIPQRPKILGRPSRGCLYSLL